MTDEFSFVKQYINPAYDLERAIVHFNTIEALYILEGWGAVYDALVSTYFFNAKKIPTRNQLVDFIMDRFCRTAVAHPYVNAVLDKLRDSGYKLAIMTNHYSADIQNMKIDLLGFRDKFDEIVVSGAVAEKMTGNVNDKSYYKPSPKLFLYTADLLGEKPQDLYYVGDNPRCDVRGAEASGFVPVWITSHSPWPYSNDSMPEYSFKTVEGLLELI